MESISDKLKSLGVHLGTSNLQPPPALSKHRVGIEEVLDGDEETTSFGNTFVTKRLYSPDYNQGKVQLYENVDLEIVLNWAKIANPDRFTREKAVFIDTETSGLAGGTGTFVFLFGMGFFNSDGFNLYQVFLRSPAEEQAFLATITRLINPFDTLVSFNGKSFDVPMLNSRHVINRFHSPFIEMKHIDVLHLARRIWRNRLENRNLGSLETDILGLERTREEIPGWLVPQIYYDYLHTGDATPLAGVFYHNANDILSLAALFNHLGKMLSNPQKEAAQYGLDLLAAAQLYEEMGNYKMAVDLYEQCLDTGLTQPFFIKALSRFADLYRRQQEWDQAVTLWEKAADYRQIEACIELSKYYEHHQVDVGKAVIWSEKAIQIANEDIPSPFMRKKVIEELDHRLQRLKRKLAG